MSTSPTTPIQPNPLPLHPSSPTETLPGTHITLEPLAPHHAPALYPLISGPAAAPLWTYMPSGPFADLATFQSYITQHASSPSAIFWAIRSNATGAILGHTSYLRIDSANAVVEIGNILYTPALQRTVGATEAWYLLASRAFAAGYRRLEWKCNALNAPSRRAALRYGHVFEGVFRQHMVVKGANRDTAWFSMLDGEWPREKRVIEAWMGEGNFDEEGRQMRGLGEVREAERERERGGV
ncbi:hypothetical protein WHR41_06458 [Cladosporium halotolerans]|uniref:N-acetyltransferase domain-containing protein n=1 Tax=Cladosporium halotolerans TaxID=1052096 RepID=A0AB34KJI6_9PEZI